MQQDNLLQTIQDFKTALRERLLDLYEQHEEIIKGWYSGYPDQNFILGALLAVAPEQAKQAMEFHKVYVSQKTGKSWSIQDAINYWELYFSISDALKERRKKRQEMQEKNESNWKL